MLSVQEYVMDAYWLAGRFLANWQGFGYGLRIEYHDIGSFAWLHAAKILEPETICALFIAYSQYGLDGIATPGIDNSPVDLAEAIEFHEAVKR